MPVLSHFDVMAIGEHLNPAYLRGQSGLLPPPGEWNYYYSYALPMDRLRAEAYWGQLGLVVLWLPQFKGSLSWLQKKPEATRDMLSRVLQVDALVWPIFCHLGEVYKVWRIRRSFGIAEEGVTFTPYWRNRAIIADKANVLVGFYRNGKRHLVIVSNMNRKATTIKLHFRKIPPRRVVDAETGRELPHHNAALKTWIPRNDYRALLVNF
jgi:hypothetical protein